MPIPGLTRTDHFGLTVPDLDEAEQFFVDVLGAHLWFRLGEKSDPDGTWMTDHLGVHRDAVIEEIRFLRLAGGAVLELFAYSAPDQQRQPPANSDVGGHHLAFYVDDLDAAVTDLRARGLRVLGEPTASAGATRGQRWVYFLSPWGLQCELVSYPQGRAVDADPADFASS